jgi:hypothetical protein
MEIRTSTVAVVAASCITIGAAGAFLASRPSNNSVPDIAPAGDVSSGAVEQSEGVVPDARPEANATAGPAPSAPAQPLAPAPAASRRASSTPQPPSARRENVRPAPAPVGTQPSSVTAAPPVAQEARAATTASEPIAPPEPPEPKAPPAPRYVDLVVSPDSVLGLQMETSVTSEKARVEDEVAARVTRDVRVGDRVAIPAGSTARGEVTMVERGGKLRERARLGIRFTSVVLADGTRVPVETDTIYREGDSPAGESAAKIGGGAIGGAILGGIFGGAKGAAIGASAGAGAGTAAVVAGGRNPATLPSGTPVTVRLIKPATVTVEE